MMNSITFAAAFALLGCLVQGLVLKPTSLTPLNVRKYGAIGGQRWGNFAGFECKVLGPVTSFEHLGDINAGNEDPDFDSQKKRHFNLNVGRAQEVLRRELPMVFAVSNLDFSIFAPHITVTDMNGNKMVMQKSLYSAAVKSLRMASAISSIYPSMNVKKIEYIEETRTIQCLVDVVLPDTVRVDGQAVWEGMFYFGLDQDGLIMAHIFDRRISTMTPSPVAHVAYPWLRAAPAWSSDLLRPAPRPVPGVVASILSEAEEKSAILKLLAL
jgi:hypothetical protein